MRANAHSCLFGTPWSVAHQAPLGMEFSRQEYWSCFPFLSPGDLPNPVIKLTSPESPALGGRFFTTLPPGNPRCYFIVLSKCFRRYYPFIFTNDSVLLQMRELEFREEKNKKTKKMLPHGQMYMVEPGGSDIKESACNVGDLSLILAEGNDSSVQYSCLENSMDRRVRWAILHDGCNESNN